MVPDGPAMLTVSLYWILQSGVHCSSSHCTEDPQMKDEPPRVKRRHNTEVFKNINKSLSKFIFSYKILKSIR